MHRFEVQSFGNVLLQPTNGMVGITFAKPAELHSIFAGFPLELLLAFFNRAQLLSYCHRLLCLNLIDKVTPAPL